MVISTLPTISEDPTDPAANGEHHGEDCEDSASKSLAKSPSYRLSFRMRPDDDDEPQDWWFASTAIPLVAATTGPLANVMSIAALITPWRATYDPDYIGQDSTAVGYPDPRWCIALNAASLVCGVVGNLFLLFNFTRFVRYIVALPMTILFWYLATGILIAITISVEKHVPPHRPDQTYSQGFWHAIIAAVLYLISSMILMINMLGYFLGHYPQHFELNDEQRNLILQTMIFFVWLAGGAGVFAKVSDQQYVDMLYFCDVTILTIGFGDFHPINDTGRGLVFPFSVGGIIILGLLVSSIHRFAREMSRENIVKTHVEKRRVQTIERSVSSSFELRRQQDYDHHIKPDKRPTISAPFDLKPRTVTFDVEKTQHQPDLHVGRPRRLGPVSRTMSSGMKTLRRAGSRRRKLLLLREEKDRFTAMRDIQNSTRTFKRYFALSMSIIAFGLLWCVGAIGFWKAEMKSQNLTYFQALYFCYVSLLTIGYGDLSPTSNAGKPFFIAWSLIAVPTMTILISDMSDTVVASFKRGTFTIGDWTVLPKAGLWRKWLDKRFPWLFRWLQKKATEAAEGKRIAQGFAVGLKTDPDNPNPPPPTLEEIADENIKDLNTMARKLVSAIRRTASDLKSPDSRRRRYSYEEWVEFTRLIRFSSLPSGAEMEEEEEQGVIEWDWIGQNSPMLAEESEAEWLLDRLCESLGRYMRRDSAGNVNGDKGKGNSKVDRDVVSIL